MGRSSKSLLFPFLSILLLVAFETSSFSSREPGDPGQVTSDPAGSNDLRQEISDNLLPATPEEQEEVNRKVQEALQRLETPEEKARRLSNERINEMMNRKIREEYKQKQRAWEQSPEGQAVRRQRDKEIGEMLQRLHEPPATSSSTGARSGGTMPSTAEVPPTSQPPVIPQAPGPYSPVVPVSRGTATQPPEPEPTGETGLPMPSVAETPSTAPSYPDPAPDPVVVGSGAAPPIVLHNVGGYAEGPDGSIHVVLPEGIRTYGPGTRVKINWGPRGGWGPETVGGPRTGGGSAPGGHDDSKEVPTFSPFAGSGKGGATSGGTGGG